ncbi:Adenylate cyclase [Smittium mucronatum]|uniref:Adenylate cyclase n=1 Tax=Smittium mucronatum TaxID=133383 RepID=A0A1R0GYL2_9FUNG|nr:Adenylate cyclase [Smittium mucronatum]
MNLKSKSAKNSLNNENPSGNTKIALGKIGFFKFFKKKDVEKDQVNLDFSDISNIVDFKKLKNNQIHSRSNDLKDTYDPSNLEPYSIQGSSEKPSGSYLNNFQTQPNQLLDYKLDSYVPSSILKQDFNSSNPDLFIKSHNPYDNELPSNSTRSRSRSLSNSVNNPQNYSLSKKSSSHLSLINKSKLIIDNFVEKRKSSKSNSLSKKNSTEIQHSNTKGLFAPYEHSNSSSNHSKLEKYIVNNSLPSDSSFISHDHLEDFDSYLRKESLSRDSGAWTVPESWSVVPLPNAETEITLSGSFARGSPSEKSDSPPQFIPIDDSLQYRLRLYRLDSGFGTFNVKLTNTVSDLLAMAGKKFFIPDISLHCIYLTEANGLSRILKMNEMPAYIFKNALKNIGYSSRDNIPAKGLQDNSYICKFTLVKAGITSIPLNIDELSSLATEVILKNKRLQTIPVPIYNHAMYIQSLDLSENPGLNLPSDFLQECVSLKDLNVSNCYFAKIPQSLEHTPNLIRIDFSSNILTKVGDVLTNFLINLQVLNLENNRISDLPSSLANLENLVDLSLRNNQFKTFPKILTRMSSLKILDISYNLIDSIPDSVSHLVNLEVLNITGNYMDGSLPFGMSKLTNLETINLELNNFDDLSPISNLPKLKNLYSGNNHLSFPIFSLDKIENIYLNQNKLADITISSRLENLTVLDLRFNKLTELPKDMFLYLSQLKTLILNNNHLVALPRSVSSLHNLEYLSLSTNSLSTLPKELFTIQNLRVLDVHRNKLKSIPPEIWLMPALKTINFSSNVLDQFPHPTSLNNSSRNNNEFGSVRTAAFSSPSIAQRLKLAHNKTKDLGLNNQTNIPTNDFEVSSLSLSISDQLPKDLYQSSSLSMNDISLSKNLEQLKCICSDSHTLSSNIENKISDPPFNVLISNEQGISTQENTSVNKNISFGKENYVVEDGNENHPFSPKNEDSNIETVKNIPNCPLHPNQSKSTEIGNSAVNSESSLKALPPLSNTFSKNNIQPIVDHSSKKTRVETLKFSSSILPPLSNSLKEINIANNFLGDDFLILCQYLPELTILNISYNDLYEIPILSMSYMNKMVELYLSGTKLSTIPEEDSSVKYWKDLRVLFINNNKLQSLPSWFAKLANLTVLDASHNQLKYNITNWQYDWNWNWNLELQYLNFSYNTRLEIVGQRFVGKKLHGSNINEEGKLSYFNPSDGYDKRPNMLRVGPYNVPMIFPDPSQDMSDFYKLKNLRTLGLLQLTVMVPLPEETPMRRVRMTEDLKFVNYGIADALGNDPTVALRDLVSSKSNSTQNEVVFGIFHAQNCPPVFGSALVKYLADKFVYFFKQELNDFENYFKQCSVNINRPDPVKQEESTFKRIHEKNSSLVVNENNTEIIKSNLMSNSSGKRSNLKLNFFHSRDKDTNSESQKKTLFSKDLDKSYKTKQLPPTSNAKLRPGELSKQKTNHSETLGTDGKLKDVPEASSSGAPLTPNIDSTRPSDFVTDAIRKTFLEVNKTLGIEIPTWKFSSSIYNQFDPQNENLNSTDNKFGSSTYSDLMNDESFRKLSKDFNYNDFKNVNLFIGAAAIVAFVQNQTLYIANLGDAKGVLSRRGNPILLSTLHTVTNKEENMRIRSLAGTFNKGEILSKKILTRGFGCFGMMPYVNAEPTIRSLQLGKDDEFVILGNNALWNYINVELAVEIARYHRNDPVVAASRLRDYAMSYGSKKAIMVMVIQFKSSDIKSNKGMMKCKSVRESVIGSKPGKGRIALMNTESKHESNQIEKIMKSSQVDLPFGAYQISLNDIESDDDYNDKFNGGDNDNGRRQRSRNHQGSNKDHNLSRNTIAPPVGEVTLVFTDVKNSTSQWDAKPAAMRQAIKIHNGIMRKILRSVGGYEVKTEGDAFMVSFSTVASALNWCLSVQLAFLDIDWPQDILETVDGQPIYYPEDSDSDKRIGTYDSQSKEYMADNIVDDFGIIQKKDKKKLIYRGLRVRMGIHVGTPLCEEDPITNRMDYFGPMVNRAARVSGVADGGQIFVSNDVAEEVVAILNLFKVAKEEEITDMSKLIRDPKLAKDVQMLWNVGMGIKLVGEKKLKGLETPETICQVYPASLKLRLDYEDDVLSKQKPKPHFNPFIDANNKPKNDLNNPSIDRKSSSENRLSFNLEKSNPQSVKAPLETNSVYYDKDGDQNIFFTHDKIVQGTKTTNRDSLNSGSGLQFDNEKHKRHSARQPKMRLYNKNDKHTKTLKKTLRNEGFDLFRNNLNSESVKHGQNSKSKIPNRINLKQILTYRSVESANSSNWSDSKSLDSQDFLSGNESVISLKMHDRHLSDISLALKHSKSLGSPYWSDIPSDDNLLYGSDSNVQNRNCNSNRHYSLSKENLFEFIPKGQVELKELKIHSGVRRSKSAPDFKKATNNSSRSNIYQMFLEKKNESNLTKVPIIKINEGVTSRKYLKQKGFLSEKSISGKMDIVKTRMSIDSQSMESTEKAVKPSWRHYKHYKFKPSKSLKSRATLDFPIIFGSNEKIGNKTKVHKHALKQFSKFNNRIRKNSISPSSNRSSLLKFMKPHKVDKLEINKVKDVEVPNILDFHNKRVLSDPKVLDEHLVVKFSPSGRLLLSHLMSKYDKVNPDLPIQNLTSISTNHKLIRFEYTENGNAKMSSSISLPKKDVSIFKSSDSDLINYSLGTSLSKDAMVNALEYLNLLSFRAETLAAHIALCNKSLDNHGNCVCAKTNSNKENDYNISFMEKVSRKHIVDPVFYKSNPIPLNLDRIRHDKVLVGDCSDDEMGNKSNMELQKYNEIFQTLVNRVEISASILSVYL